MALSARFRKLALLLFAATLCAALASCSGTEDKGEQIDLSDALGGSSIMTSGDLIAFIARGEGNTAVLGNNIDLDREMLRLTRARGDLTIEGNGFTITGSGDCVIRLEDGMSLTLNNVTIVGGYDAVGALGDCTVYGKNATVKGVANAVNCIGQLNIGKNSELVFVAQEGNGAAARGVTLLEGASLQTAGGLSGIVSTDGDITLSPLSRLYAETDKNYNALQCARTLTLKDGCTLSAVNRGLYHGAETETLFVEGAVTVEATGGEKGTGLFIYTLSEDVRILGSCEPEARFENGNGSIAFVKSVAELATPSPEPLQTPEE
ncbi:MAG: hypothetical protein ABFC62_10205 [Clostridiaceae bacterium]|nr:hypothetical protein [Eubacteriales bacterium]